MSDTEREARARPAGWYPDPDQPSLLRHWDGRAWGRRVRSRPSWASATAPAAAPAPPSRHRWRTPLLITLAAVALVAFAGSLLRGGSPPPRTISDRAFAAAASDACARRLPPLRPTTTTKDESPTREEVAAADERVAADVDRAAAGIGALADELASLPVAEPDRAAVARWVSDWRAFAAVGHRYADATRRRDAKAVAQVAGEGNGPAERIYRFAVGNGIDACVLRVELPARRGAL